MTSTKLNKAAEAIARADLETSEALGEHRDDPPVRVLSAVAKLGDQPELRLISAGMIAAGLLTGRGRVSRAGLRMLMAHEIATAAKDFAKKRIDRTRPNSANGGREAKPSPGRKTAKKDTSFPSGHSAGAVAVAQAFAREFPEYRAPALAAAGLVAFGQVPKEAHYPSDIFAGSAIGVGSEAALAAVWPAKDD